MKFTGYYHEKPQASLYRSLRKTKPAEQKIELWNAFVDSELTGVTDDDFSIYPRIIPASYWPVIKRQAYLITQFTMELLSLPEQEIRAIVPKGPIRDHLLDKLEVLRHRTGRITGSYRFDMAIVGAPTPDNPPFLLEINEIGFDGLARSSFFQRTLLKHLPHLRKRLKMLDTAAAEIRNMQRLGNKIARLQYDNYNWDEEYMLRTAERLGSEVRLVCPREFGLKIDPKDWPLLHHESLPIKNGQVLVGGPGDRAGRNRAAGRHSAPRRRGADSHANHTSPWRPDAINFSFAYSYQDYKEGHKLYKSLMQSRTPQYGPFLTGLVAAKTILVLLDDRSLRRRLMGSERHLERSILPAHLLSDSSLWLVQDEPKNWVIKHTDGCGGDQVFMDKEMQNRVRRIPRAQRHEWVLQQKTNLNLIDIDGLLSHPKKAISDLGVFVQYDWSHGRFNHFEVGGLMCRATNKSLKVNVSGGGSQVAVLIDRAT